LGPFFYQALFKIKTLKPGETVFLCEKYLPAFFQEIIFKKNQIVWDLKFCFWPEYMGLGQSNQRKLVLGWEGKNKRTTVIIKINYD